MTDRTDAPEFTETALLERFGLAPRGLERVMSAALTGAVDDADLYFEHTVSETLSLEEGIVKKATHDVHQGAGVRVIEGERTGYAHTDEIGLPQLEAAARTAHAIARHGGPQHSVAIAPVPHAHDLYPVERAAVDEPMDRKIGVLEAMDRAARAVDPRITQVMATVALEQKVVLIARRDGQLTGDVRPLVRVSVQCIAEEGSNRQVGRSGGGGRSGFDALVALDGAEEAAIGWALEAARQALVNLDAAPAPAGTMDVVLGPGWPGILLHEAIGHGLEGDFNRKGTSAFSGLLGQRVASELCTIVDDGTIPGRRGSLNVDDEGTPTQRTVLIERGILRGYMQDRLNSRLSGHSPTGNGRRQSFAHVPMPRMTNTFMLAGESDPQDVIRSVKRGLYAVSFGGGQVDITSGKFVFSATEAYLIEDGRIGRPVRGATLIGNGPDVLTRVSMVGHDLKLDTGVGVCGKDGQGVPVGVGLPTIKIDGLTVGGTSA
ncbi:MAG: peptidase U62 [Myxococcales bacterium]